MPKGRAIMVRHKMMPTSIKMLPSPAVISFPDKEKTRSTRNQTNFRGKKISSNSNDIIYTLLINDDLTSV